ncbi:MAG TPA: iron ABC transporter substrate-binding protein [Gaiellaceae bacterium]|nr:iron ABC transporter substrate-binding protein [Gaiellaceae bacterium]
MKFIISALAVLALAGCGGNDESGVSDSLTVYSGREEEIVAPLFERFEEETGIDVEVRYGDSAELAATIAEEGENSPADVFFGQDPGSLGAVSDRLASLPDDVLERVDERFRGGDKWVGTSGRTRVIVYNTDALSEDEVPDSVFDLVDPRWRGKIGIAPTNASFQAFVTAMRLDVGEERTREWLEGVMQNDPKFYEKNTPIVEAAASGEIELGLVNHYYLYLVRTEQGEDAPIENHHLAGDDPGALVTVAGAGVLEGAEHEDAAVRFLEFLLADEQQRFYTEEAAEAEIPLVEGIEPKEGIPSLEELADAGPEVDFTRFGAELERTLELLNETGYTS